MSDAQRDATTQEQPAYRAYMEKTYTTVCTLRIPGTD